MILASSSRSRNSPNSQQQTLCLETRLQVQAGTQALQLQVSFGSLDSSSSFIGLLISLV